jgi:RNA polymerase sigma-70 factor (ECF subfamily)
MGADHHLAGDAQLVVAVGRFEEAALAELYRRHGGVIHAIALRLLGDHGRADDVTQEVFTRLWQRPYRFDPDRSSLRTYLVTDAHGRAVDRLRADQRRVAREERHERDATRVEADLEREVWELLRAERVREALGDLPAGEREAILLAYFDGRTYREVAMQLGIPEGTAKSRIRAGLHRLARHLEAAGYGVNHGA